jgi:hypothetical protein
MEYGLSSLFSAHYSFTTRAAQTVHQAHGGYDMVAPRRQAHPVLLRAQRERGIYAPIGRARGQSLEFLSIVRARLTDSWVPLVRPIPSARLNIRNDLARDRGNWVASCGSWGDKASAPRTSHNARSRHRLARCAVGPIG